MQDEQGSVLTSIQTLLNTVEELLKQEASNTPCKHPCSYNLFVRPQEEQKRGKVIAACESVQILIDKTVLTFNDEPQSQRQTIDRIDKKYDQLVTGFNEIKKLFNDLMKT